MTKAQDMLVMGTLTGYHLCRATNPVPIPQDATEYVIAYFRYCVLVVKIAQRRRDGG